MSIKMKSQSLLTVFLVGSLCGLTNYVNASHNDFTEEEGSRLQITGSTNLILAAIADSDLDVAGVQTTVDALQDNGVPAGTVIVGGTTFTALTNDLTSISLALAAIEGASFATGTDSLKIISDNQGTQGLGALATAAIQTTQGTTALATFAVQALQATAAAQATQGVGPFATAAIQTTQGTTALATFAVQALQATAAAQATQGVGPFATSVQAVDIQGAGFIAAASLIANAQRTAANQVVTIANSAALNGTALTWNGLGTWATVYTAITAAVTLPTTQVEITAITDAITALGTVNVPTTGYTAPQINNIVLQLQAAVTNWDALIS